MVRNKKNTKKIKKENAESFDPKAEVGRSGLSRMAGVINEEWLTQLNSLTKSNKAYREMRDNDPVVGAIFFTIDMLCRQVKWTVKPGGENTQALEKAEKAVEAGPLAEENFIQAYKFATAKEGLALGTSEAISFAEKMASRSSQN